MLGTRVVLTLARRPGIALLENFAGSVFEMPSYCPYRSLCQKCIATLCRLFDEKSRGKNSIVASS